MLSTRSFHTSLLAGYAQHSAGVLAAVVMSTHQWRRGSIGSSGKVAAVAMWHQWQQWRCWQQWQQWRRSSSCDTNTAVAVAAAVVW